MQHSATLPSRSSSQADESIVENGMVQVSSHGDVVLSVRHEVAGKDVSHRFRVRSAALKSHSRYFAKLLSPSFSEGQRVEQASRDLLQAYGDVSKVPPEEIAVVEILDVGRVSVVKSIRPLFEDFLNILHGSELLSTPPVANLANLAVVADRFDALTCVKDYERRKKIVRLLESKTTAKTDSSLSEDKTRQRLLIAALFDSSPWLGRYSLRMITKGWTAGEIDETTALWMDLPFRLEEELATRRDFVLDTIQSLQTYFIKLYTSRDRQCKLGYDSSAQCDSFQLGEMIRFFHRIGTLRIQGLLLTNAEPGIAFDGDINDLLDTIRQVPEYQIDRNHSHCGIRTRIVPMLALLQESLQHVGLCAECWSQDRAQQLWCSQKPPLLWKRSTHRSRIQNHKDQHTQIRALFTATDKDWGD